MRDGTIDRMWGALALMALALAAGFRLWGSIAAPLWLDEAYSAYAAAGGLGFLWRVVPSYETHPPFYYTLVWGWTRLFGDGLPSLRAIGQLAGLATVPVIAVAAHETARLAGTARLATIAAAVALFALAPLAVEMAREVRPYPLMILVYAVALAALLRVTRRRAAGGPIGGWPFALYLLALAGMLWLHNLGTLYAAALGLGCLVVTIRRDMTRGDWGWLIGGHLVVGLVWLPALLILLDQAPTWVGATWLTFNPALLPRLVPMLYAGPALVAQLAGLALAGLAIVALWRRTAGWRTIALLLLAALVPVALSIALSALVAPVFILRTMTPVLVPAGLLFAIGAGSANGWRRWAGAALLLMALGGMIDSDIASRRRGPPQDWYGAVRWLAPKFRRGDLVLAYPNEGALPFDRAVRDLHLALPSRPIPTAVPSIGIPGGWYPTGSRGVVSLPRDRLAAIAAAPEVARVPTVWLLRLGPWAYDKGDLFLDELRRTRTPVARFRAGAIDIIGLRNPPRR